MDNEEIEVYKILQNSYDKYIYFLLATTITAIGFAVTRTQNLKINITSIPLGMSIICWGTSFLYGCRNREYYNLFLALNIKALQKVADTNFSKVELKEYLKEMDKHSEKAEKFGKIQKYSFIIGVILYLVWHIIQMYLNA